MLVKFRVPLKHPRRQFTCYFFVLFVFFCSVHCVRSVQEFMGRGRKLLECDFVLIRSESRSLRPSTSALEKLFNQMPYATRVLTIVYASFFKQPTIPPNRSTSDRSRISARATSNSSASIQIVPEIRSSKRSTIRRVGKGGFLGSKKIWNAGRPFSASGVRS